MKRFLLTGLLALSADAWGMELSAGPRAEKPFHVEGDFAVVKIVGPLTQHADIFGLCDSYHGIAERFIAACASACPAVVLKISSPGGQVAGCFELAAQMRAQAVASGKRLVAYVDGLAASAGYALACAADEIVIPPSGIAGSIGVLHVLTDVTKLDGAMGIGWTMIASGARKVDGNPHVALSDEARAAVQSGVDDMAERFFELVASARGVSVEDVRALEAAVYIGQKAVDAKLADRVQTFAELVRGSAEQPTAQAATEDSMGWKEAMQKAADEGDEEAKKALAALEEDDEDKAESEEEDKEKSESDDEDKAESEEEDKDKASARSGASAKIVSLDDVKALIAESDERKALLASRSDLPSATLEAFARLPIANLRDVVKTTPRAVAKGQVAAARAAIGAAPTVGGADHPSSPANGLAKDEHDKLMEQMGIRPASASYEVKTREDGATVFPVLTPSVARDLAAKKGIAQ